MVCDPVTKISHIDVFLSCFVKTIYTNVIESYFNKNYVFKTVLNSEYITTSKTSFSQEENKVPFCSAL